MLQPFRRSVVHLTPLVLFAFTVTASDLPRDRAGLLRLDTPSAVQRVLGTRSNETGTVTVSALSGAGYRVQVEDSALSEIVDLDTANDEIRALGLTFHLSRDQSEQPTALEISGNGEKVTLPANAARESLTGEQRASIARLNKFLAATHAHDRIEHLTAILKSFTTTSAHGRLHPNSAFDCVMDIVALATDWIVVVAACGAPIIDIFACGWAIMWATADTLHETFAIGNDC